MTTAIPRFILFCCLLTSILLSNFTVAHATPLPTILEPASYKQVQTLFAGMDYRWDTLHNGIPDISLVKFPTDLNLISNIKQKKQLFYMSLLPMVIKKNNEILRHRQTVEQLLQQFDRYGTLTSQQQKTLYQLGKQYRCNVTALNDTKIRQRLLRRIDIVPAALVIAQAANESAYGTSRFAQLANNIFGEWTFTVGTGIVPQDRSTDKTHEIKIFNSIGDSIDSYLKNINTHRAYKKLRLAREKMRKDKQPIQSTILAEGLVNYSTRRGKYVSEIQNMIRYNRLAKLSKLELRNSTPLVTSSTGHHLPMLHIADICSRTKIKQQVALL